MLVLGIDVGTQGVRILVSDSQGCVVAQSSVPFDICGNPSNPPSWFEQNPENWLLNTLIAIKDAVDQLNEKGISPNNISAVAVDSTSGSIVPIDKDCAPLRNAIMYSDSRSNEEAELCNKAAVDFTKRLGYQFNASFGLPKMLWIARNQPDIWKKTWKLLHAADFIVGNLTDNYNVSDNSNALKSGYDLINECWPEFIGELGIPMEKLPDIVRPGEHIGRITAKVAAHTGLSAGTPVVGGVSDGTAGFIASGASKPGDWNSTLGTTLVLRGVSENIVSDVEGRIYCHKHPDGYWLPGGASNSGAECLAKVFKDVDYNAFNEKVYELAPTKLSIYPLVRVGERLPFINARAEGFVCGTSASREELYTAYLEGVAYVERWCYELMALLGAPINGTLYTTGGGAKSREWMSIRASVLNRSLVRPSITEAAMGTVVIAASRTLYGSLAEASEAMVRKDIVVEPEMHLVEQYQEKYTDFRRECAARGLG